MSVVDPHVTTTSKPGSVLWPKRAHVAVDSASAGLPVWRYVEPTTSRSITWVHPDVLFPNNRVVVTYRELPPRQQQQSVNKRKFRRLAREWLKEAKFSSDLRSSLLHPAYQKIIGMGSSALPFLFAELRDSSQYWFWAIDSIVGEKILPENFAGGFEDARDFYLAWGRSRDFDA